MILRIVLTIIIGIIAGLVGGGLGIGGTFIILPGLLFLNIIPDYKIAIGTVILSMLPPISILAAIDYYKRKQIDFLIAGILCISYVIAAKYGAFFNKEYSNQTLKYTTSLIFFIFSLYFLWSGKFDKGN
jgi:uncharacterized membrane protein YfcA